MIKVGVISDLHLTGDGNLFQEFQQTLDILIESHQIEHLIVLGDTLQTGDAGSDKDQLVDFIDELEVRPIEYTVMLGNKDVETNPKREITEFLTNDPYGTIELDCATAIYLDTTKRNLGKAGLIRGEEIEFLRSKLEDEDIENPILLTHHPVHYTDISDNNWFSESPELAFCVNKTTVNEVLKETDGVKLGVNAHLHTHKATEYNETLFVTTGAFNESPTEESDTPVGKFGIIEVDGRTIEYTQYDENNEPQSTAGVEIENE